MPRRGTWPWARHSPLEGLDAVEQYEKIRWGRKPTRARVVDTPALTKRQELIELGRLRALHVQYGRRVFVIKPSRPYPYITIGRIDNRLYIVGGSTDRMARAKQWGPIGSRGTILRTDYDSLKGSTDAYWYHEHEHPYPMLVILPSGHPAYRGGRYKVSADGIEG